MLSILKITSLLGLIISINTVSVSAQPNELEKIIEKEGFSFELKDCNNISTVKQTLKCDFIVKNIEDGTRELIIYANRSRVIDTDGNVIGGSTINLGNQGDDTHADSDLVNGVPVKLSVTFAKPPIGNVKLIDLGCYAKGSFNAEFVF